MLRCADRVSAASGPWVFSAAAEFGGAGSKLAQQPRYNVLCLGSSISPRDLACLRFRLRLNLSITIEHYYSY
jgi:hypothetical protein